MKSLTIIGMSILAGVIYGIAQDQITARLCVEYFTIFHAPVFGTDDPTLLGVGWGILATWWVGLILGVPLAMVARVGRLPKRSAVDLIRPMAMLMVVTACVATLAGIVSFVVASNGWIWVVEPWASRIPPEKHVLFLTDLWAHNASYATMASEVCHSCEQDSRFASELGTTMASWAKRCLNATFSSLRPLKSSSNIPCGARHESPRW